MQNRVWFVYNHLSVHGPYTMEELNQLSSDGVYQPKDLVWKKGQKEWLSVDYWRKLHPVVVSQEDQTKLLDLSEAWYVFIENQHQGPFTFEQIVDKLRAKLLKMNAKVWTDGLDRWLPVYEAHEIIEALGLSRRKSLRVPMVGKVTLASAIDGLKIPDLSMLTLSEGGLGVKAPLELGKLLTAKIESPLLSYPVQAQAKVVYSGANDSGLQFTFVSSEMHSAIVEYINQFKGLETTKAA